MYIELPRLPSGLKSRANRILKRAFQISQCEVLRCECKLFHGQGLYCHCCALYTAMLSKAPLS